jgi:uncharacterized protein (TIGR02996 family)
MDDKELAARRKAFEDAIERDPYDMQTRKVYADWLDEFGSDPDADLAAEQRAWTVEKQRAIDWLTEYARDLEMTCTELIEVAQEHARTGYAHGLPFDTPDRVYEDNDAFWEQFELATGQTVDPEKKQPFFRCAC